MREIYRKSNLEKVSSPEQLDKLVPITTISSWLVLVATILLISACVVWLFEGRIYEEEDSKGIYISDSKINNIYSNNIGIVNKVHIKTGDNINVDDIIAIIDHKNVKSTYTGIVHNINIQEGEVVDSSNIIAEVRTFSEESEEFLVRCYVPIKLSKTLEKGMEAIIVPSHIDEEQYGHMTGSIRSIGTYSITDTEFYSKLGDKILINKFYETNGNEPLIEVIVSIDADKNTLSGYKWSSKRGNDMEIKEYTMVDVRFVVSISTPYSMLFSN